MPFAVQSPPDLDTLCGERYPLRQAARLLGVSLSSLWRWLKPPGFRGRVLRSFLVGNQRFVTREDLEKFVQQIQGFKTSPRAACGCMGKVSELKAGDVPRAP